MAALLLEPEAAATASILGYASPSEWNRVRSVIKRLYVDEDKTLKEVMTIMARDYGHHASMKMYKARITKWGLDKKTKEAEAWAVLRVKVRRDAVGKDSEFRVRGKPVTVEDVLRYFKRKGIMHPEVPPQRSEASTPPAIEYWTPIPSPKLGNTNIQVPEEEDVQNRAEFVEYHGTEMNGVPYVMASVPIQGNDSVQAYLNVDQTRQLLFSCPEVQSFEIPYSPLPPQRLLVPEKLFASIRAYYGGAFSSGLFITNENGYLKSSNVETGKLLIQFYQLCCTGADLMTFKSFVEGRQCLSKASGLVSHLLQGHDPMTLPMFLDVFTQLGNSGNNELVKILRKLAREIAIILFAEEHPWRQIFSQIDNLDEPHFELALAEVWRCVCDTFAHFLGDFNPVALNCYVRFLSAVYRSCNPPHLLHGLLIRGEKELGKFDPRLIEVKYEYAWVLYSQKRKVEAMFILEEVLACCRETGGQKNITIAALGLISDCQFVQGRKYEAEITLRQAIKTGEEAYGKADSRVLVHSVRLLELLRSWGREAEAAALQVEIDEILGPDDIELEDITFEAS